MTRSGAARRGGRGARSRALALLVIACAPVCACGDARPASPTAGGAPDATSSSPQSATVQPRPRPPLPPRDAPIAPVLAPRLAAATTAPPNVTSLYPAALDASAPQLNDAERELLEFARGMAQLVAQDATAASDAARDVRTEGAGVVRALVTVVLDPSERTPVREAALDLLPATGVADAAHALVHVATVADEAWLRRRAVWRARDTAAIEGADGVLLGLILRLKYEQDDEATVWLAGSLTAFGNLGGVEALQRLASGSSDAAPAAIAELERVTGSSPTDAAPQPPSAALLDALWRQVSELSGEHFQLRGVDDARFALSRLGAELAPELALALADEDPFVRLHVAQVLERMGPRASAGASAALLARLGDPHDGVAAAAAEALGAVEAGGSGPAFDAARAALEARTDARVEHELRVASIRGLGHLAGADASGRLTELALAAHEPDDVRMAAAEGLVRAGVGDVVLPLLVDQLTDPLADAGAAETLLGRWLEGTAATRGPAHAAAHELWRALAPAFERVHGPEEVKARRRARAALVAPFVGTG